MSSPFPSGFGLQDGTKLNAALGQPVLSVLTGQTATGTTIANAFVLRNAVTRFSTVAASTGAVLPSAAPIGSVVTIFNDGANALTVYAPSAGTIDGTAGATGVALANAKRAAFYLLASGVWESAQLGAVSA